MNTIKRIATEEEKRKVVLEVVNAFKSNYKQMMQEELTQDEEIESFEKLMNDANILYVEKPVDENTSVKAFHCVFISTAEEVVNVDSKKDMNALSFANQTILLCDNGELGIIHDSVNFLIPCASLKDFEDKYSSEIIPKEWMEVNN